MDIASKLAAAQATVPLHSYRYLGQGAQSEDDCHLLPRAWFPSLVAAGYSPASIDEMFAACDADTDGGVTWGELNECFEADEGDAKRLLLKELHECYDRILPGSTFDKKLDLTEFTGLVLHQSSLRELAHGGDGCAKAFLAFDSNEDLLLQFSESRRWILEYGDETTGANDRQKKKYHRDWWTGAELNGNDLTWSIFTQICPGVPVTGSPDPPAEPEQPDPPAEPE